MIDENFTRIAKLHQSITSHQGAIWSGSLSEPVRPFRLSIITQYYPPDYAATGQLIEELATHLGDRGLEIHIFTGQPGYAFGQKSAPPRECLDNLNIRRTRTAQFVPQRIRGKALNGLFFFLRSALHLLKSAGRGDVLLLTTAPPFLPILGYFVHLCFGLPYVCLLYDLYPDVAIELNVIEKTHWMVKFWDALNARIWQKAQAIIVLSSSMKQRVEAKCPEVSDKISIIHSWANPNQILPIPKDQNWFAHRHNLANKFSVLYSGNMGRCHDLETIMEAAIQLQHEPIQFVFIGSGAKRQVCLDLVEEKGLKNCLFLPYQDKQLLPYSLTSCDLSLVSISPGMEGLVAPSKLYGILAAGRPVAAICEPHSYLRQLIADANCGASFNNEDSTGLANFIRRLAYDSQLTQLLGNSGRHYLLSHFTPEIIAQEYLQVLSYSVQSHKVHQRLRDRTQKSPNYFLG